MLGFTLSGGDESIDHHLCAIEEVSELDKGKEGKEPEAHVIILSPPVLPRLVGLSGVPS